MGTGQGDRLETRQYKVAGSGGDAAGKGSEPGWGRASLELELEATAPPDSGCGGSRPAGRKEKGEPRSTGEDGVLGFWDGNYPCRRLLQRTVDRGIWSMDSDYGVNEWRLVICPETYSLRPVKTAILGLEGVVKHLAK